MKCITAHAPDQQFINLTACERKLLSVLVQALWLCNHFPDWSSSKNVRRGGEAYLMIFSTLLLQWYWKSSWTEWRETLMTLSAPQPVLCRTFLSDILQLEYHMPACSPPNHCRRSWGCWWEERFVSAFSGNTVSAGPVSWSLRCFYFQPRSCDLCTPRNFMFFTLSTVRPLMLRVACSGCDLQKFVLSALSTRLLSLHQPLRCLTSSLCIDSSFLWMSPITVVSSTNLMIWFPSCLDAQLCVSSVNNNVLSTQPWMRSCAQHDGVGCVISDTDRLRSLRQKVLDPETLVPLVSWGWWYWMLSWNQCTGFWHRCLSGPDEWWLSAKCWTLHPLWSGRDYKQTDKDMSENFLYFSYPQTHLCIQSLIFYYFVL